MNKLTYENILQLEDILENGIKFKDICNKLNIPVPRSQHTKDAILSQLEDYCDIEEIKSKGKHTQYIIHKIYNQDIIHSIHSNNHFQAYVEQAIINLALNSNQDILYLSNSAILEATYMVNPNFKIACSPDMIQLDGREWIAPEANEIYNILYRWIKKRLQQMDGRHLIQLQKGYRLYKTFKSPKGEEIHMYKNVQKNTEEEKICQELYATAIQNTNGIPKNWDGGWLNPSVYSQLKRNLNKLCRETFAKEGWFEIGVVNVIIPVRNPDILKERLKDVKETLNEEAVRKVQTTTRLNHLTGFQRAQITKEIIALNPDIDYKSLLQEKKKQD